MEKTYISYLDVPKRNQVEYQTKTPLLAEDGTVLVKGGWARHCLFEYNREYSKPNKRKKEWDFYQISNGKYMLQISFANISIAGYGSICLVDIEKGETVTAPMALFVGGNDKYVLPACSDQPSVVDFVVGKGHFKFITEETKRTLSVQMENKGVPITAEFEMDMMPGLEGITTVLPFKDYPTRYFMTTKMVCMPCGGVLTIGEKKYEFSKEDTFCSLDWGRVNTPYKLVWYWGSGSTYVTDKDGNKHPFGFEITWGIGDESNATETCIFYDGKVHKIGSVDVKTVPKPDKYMEPWEFISEDNRFNLTMTPFYDHHSDLNIINLLRMHSHQVHGKWNGNVVLDDGTVVEIKDMYAFCEYVENKW